MTAMLTIGAISCVICLALWIWFLSKLSKNDLLVQQHQSIVPWGLLDVYLVFVVFAVLVPISMKGICIQQQQLENVVVEGESGNDVTIVIPPAQLEPAEKAYNRFASGIIQLFAVALIILYLAFRHQADFDDLGISISNLSQIGAGLAGGFMMIPLAIGLVALLSLWWKYEHRTLTEIQQGYSPLGLWAMIFAVGIVTPILEEFLFRGVIQGSLQRMAQLKSIDYWSAILGGKATQPNSGELAAENSRVPIWPIFVSAAIFAGMHLGQGPAPIPLYFLAVGLGYLYWRTHSIIPCIIIHIMLNIWSLLLIALKTTTAT